MITDEQRQSVLKANGFDPSKYTVDDTGNVYPITQAPQSNVQPATGVNDVLTKPYDPVKDTPLETTVKSFAQAAPASIAGGIGAGLLTAEEVPFAHTFPPWSEIGAGVIGAVSGGYLASKAQKAIEPESWQQNVTESQQENPRAAMLGELSTIPLGGFNPSPSSAIQGLGTLGKFAVGMPRTAEELANLSNVGIGAGIGAGTGLAQNLMSGQPVTPGNVLENAAIGALFNKPNAIGRRFGFEPPPMSYSDMVRQAAMTGKPLDTTVAPEAAPQQDVEIKPTLSPIDVLRGVSSGDVGLSLPKFDKQGNPLPQKEVLTPRKNAQESASYIEQLNRAGQTPEDKSAVIQDQQKQADYERMVNEAAQRQLAQQNAGKAEVARQSSAEQQSNLAASAMEIQNALRSGGIGRPEQRPTPLATTPTGTEIPKDFTGVTEQANKEAQEESPADLEARRLEGLQDRFQQEREPLQRTDYEKSVMDMVKQSGLSQKPTTHLFDLLNNWFQTNRGVGLRLNPNIKGMGETAVPTDAKSSVLGYLSGINPKTANVDTLFHEPFHVFYNRLKYSDRPSDQRLVGKFENLVKDLPEYQAKFGNDPHGVEEYITSNQGWEAVRRHILQAKDTTGLRGYFKDMLSYIKTRFGNNASEADFRRIMDYRFANDPVWTKQHAGELSGIGAPLQQREQEEKPSAQRIGRQEGFGDIPAQDLYNVNQDTHDVEKNIKYVKGSTISEKTAKRLGLELRQQAERQTPPDDKMVKQAIDSLVHGTDNASIKPEDADELTRALIEQVDWRRAPEVEHLLKQPNFDNLDPDVWSTIKKVYDNAMGKFATVKEKPVAQETKTPVAPIKDNAPKGESLETIRKRLIAKPEDLPSVEKTSALIGHAPEKTPEQRERELFDAKQRWLKVEHTENPKLDMDRLADAWRKNENPNRRQEMIAQMQYLSDKYGVEKPELEGLRRQEERQQPELLNEKDVKARSGFAKMREAIEQPNKAEKEAYEAANAEGTTREQRSREVSPNEVNLGAKNINKASREEKRNEKDIGWTTFKPTQTQNEVVLKKGGVEGKRFIDAVNRFYPERDQMYAKYYNDIHDATAKLSRKEADNVERTLVAENRSKKDYSDYLTTPAEKNAYRTIREALRGMQEDRIEAKQPVTRFTNDGRPYQDRAKIDPFYYPNQIAPKVVDALTKAPNSAVAESLRQDFIKHQIDEGKTPAQAQSVLNSILKAYDANASDQSHFRGLDIQQGVGLPDSWMRSGLQRNLSNYVRKFTTARSFHDNIEANPDVAKSLGYTQDAWGRPIQSDAKPLQVDEAHNIMNTIKGEDYSPEESKLKSFNRIATSLMLGPLTNVHIAASSLFNGLSYFHPTDVVKALGHVVSNWSDGIQHAVDNGYIKKNVNSLHDLVDAHTSAQEKLNSVANAIQSLTGRNATDYVTKGLLQNLGEYLTKVSASRAALGDKSSIRLMEHIDPDYKPGKQYSQDELNKLASTFGGILHGTHDSRTLPPWMLKDTMVQPFLSLMSWNVAQTNNFMRHVWTPMVRDGNYVPMITATLGSLLGGYVIKELREDISGKKSPFPSLQELAASSRGLEGNIPLAAYNLMAMASYSGYASMLGIGAKSIADMAFKNTPQSATFPLDEALSSSVTSVSQAVSAFMNEQHDDYLKIGTNLITDLLKNNVQLARIGINYGTEAGLLGEEKQERQKLSKESQDVRRFKMAEGMPYESQAAPSGDNPYLNLGEKEFRYTQDVGHAASELPDLLREAMRKSNGNIGVLRSELQKLKSQGGYETMFDPEQMPQSFLHYLNYLRTTQGEQAASDRLVDYFKRRTINEAKASLVPEI